MKANRNNILKNDTGDVGIGMLIIFIAMVLVAAVAAAVLIQTSGVLQEKAQQTGKQATAEVSSIIKVVNVVGTRPNATGNVESLDIAVELSAGGSNIDFSQVIVKYLNETTSTTLTYDATTANATHFRYSEDRDPSGTLAPVLAAGDLGIIKLDLSATGSSQELEVRKKGTIQIIPESGTMIVKDIVAPAAYGTYTKVQLFPYS